MTSHKLKKKAIHPVILRLDVTANSKQHQNSVDFPRGSPEYNLPPSPRVETVDCGDEAASWLSDFLGQPCRLIKQRPDFTREMKKRPSEGTSTSVSPVLPRLSLFTPDLCGIQYTSSVTLHSVMLATSFSVTLLKSVRL